MSDQIDTRPQRTYKTPAQLGKRIRKHVVTLCVWRREHKGPPFVKIGGRILYADDDVDAWIANHTTRAA